MRERLRRSRGQEGFTLPELLVVLVILGIVIGALVQLFVSATRAEVDMSNRFQAQQEGRLALDALRREIHCANAVTTDGSTAAVPGDFPRTSVVINLGSYCPSNTATPTGSPPVKPAQDVTWCTIGSGSRWALWRIPGTACDSGATGAVKKADFLTTATVFPAYAEAGGGLRAKLSIDLPVDVKPTVTGGLYRLTDDIVLRNTPRSS